MEHFNLQGMTNGWFIGNFEPSAYTTTEFEVAVKAYKAGDSEPKHFHKLATEITVIVTGKVNMCGQDWGPGSIIRLSPEEATDFYAHEDSLTVVVKTPSAIGDKFES